MSLCDDLLDLLERKAMRSCPPELAAHAQSCGLPEAVRARPGLAEAGDAVLRACAPRPSCKAAPQGHARLPLACENAPSSSAALDGELDPRPVATSCSPTSTGAAPARRHGRRLATLREVGAVTRVPAQLRASAGASPAQPPRARAGTRRTFDLRLATAAAYLLAAMTVFLIGNPAHIARARSAPIEKAAVYTRAVVENRFDSYTRRRARTAVVGPGLDRRASHRCMATGRPRGPAARDEPDTPCRRY